VNRFAGRGKRITPARQISEIAAEQVGGDIFHGPWSGYRGAGPVFFGQTGKQINQVHPKRRKAIGDIDWPRPFHVDEVSTIVTPEL
jgi:hypothetical protein